MTPGGVLADIEETDWSALRACHDAARLPGLFRTIAAGTRESLVAADDMFQTISHQGSLFEATIPATRYIARLASTDLRPDVRNLLISYLISLGHGTTFVEPAGGRHLLDADEFDARVTDERRIVAEVKNLVTAAADALVADLESAPAVVREALLGLAHLVSRPLDPETLERLATVATHAPPEKTNAARLAMAQLLGNPIDVDVLEAEWRNLSDGDHLLMRARAGEFSDGDWVDLMSQTALWLCGTPFDRDALWARAQLDDRADLISLDAGDGPLPPGRHCIRSESDEWHVYYSDGGGRRWISVHAVEADACHHTWARVQNSPRPWDAAAYRETSDATIAALTAHGHAPPTPDERRAAERSAQRLAALGGLSWITLFRRIGPNEQAAPTVDTEAVGVYVHSALSGRSSNPDGYMPLLEYWLVAASADHSCDDELRLAVHLALEALGPTLPPDRKHYTADPTRAASRRRKTEARMREWAEGRGLIPPG